MKNMHFNNELLMKSTDTRRGPCIHKRPFAMQKVNTCPEKYELEENKKTCHGKNVDRNRE